MFQARTLVRCHVSGTVLAFVPVRGLAGMHLQAAHVPVYRAPYGALCGRGGWASKMRAWARSRTGAPAELEELLQSCAERNFDASLRLILAIPGMAAPNPPMLRRKRTP